MIGIVILNYINWKDTKKCIDSIFNNELNCEYHIYVVDNASPLKAEDDIVSFFKNKKITFIQKKKNDGYSSGNNVGIKQALKDGCDEILIANSDIIFKKGSILKMQTFLAENKYIGIVGPKVYLPSGEIQMVNMVVKTGLKEKYMYLLRKTIFSNLVKDFIQKYCALDQKMINPFEVHSVSGCCFMMSKECARELTPFDENTFLYQEELIIGIQMEKLGYKTYYLPNSEIVHAHSQSTKFIKAFSYICLVESEMYYFKKYLDTNTILLLPLYLVRTANYVKQSFKSSDFRSKFPLYLKRTIKELVHNY